jgi:predicted GNAT family acetyltransferase
VPIAWFAEVFDEKTMRIDKFVCWVAYRGAEPVATAATITCNGAVGIYNVATVPGHRERGYGEAITRYALSAALRDNKATHAVLQATAQGFPLYQKMGFEPVTRILVYNSVS